MAPPLRVLRVVTRLNVGGPTRHVGMLQRGIEPIRCVQRLVCGPCPEDEGPHVLGVDGVIVPTLRRALHPLRDWRALRDVRRIVEEFDAQIVHSHTAKAGIIGRLIARRDPARKSVHTFHGHTFDGYFGFGGGLALRAVERWLLKHTSAIVVQSVGQGQSIAQHLGRNVEARLHIVPPAVDCGFIEAPVVDGMVLREQLQIPQDALVLLFPARLVAVKRPLHVLTVFAALRKLRPVVLLIAGDGPLKQSAMDHARRLGINSAVRWMPFRDDLWSLYDAADLTLLLSRSEGTPLVIPESHARQVPVAAVDVGGVKEFLHPADLLVAPAASASFIAAQVHEFLKTRRRADSSALEARLRVVQELGAARLCERLTRLYESIC